jgi:16S rRNA (cytosine967-C5)-methyltransferase
VTPAARLQATLDLMHEVESIPRPADAVVSSWFRARRYIHDHARGQISELLYTLLRHHARLGWWLESRERPDTPRNRLLAWLALLSRQGSRRKSPAASATLSRARWPRS